MDALSALTGQQCMAGASYLEQEGSLKSTTTTHTIVTLPANAVRKRNKTFSYWEGRD